MPYPRRQRHLYKVKFAACSDCHKDAHDNQFAAAPYKNRCEDCHTVHGLAPHQLLHRQTPQLPLPAAGRARRRSLLRLPQSGFGRPHGQDSALSLSKIAIARPATRIHTKVNSISRWHASAPTAPAFGCEACHSVKSWGDINGFDHSKTKYPSARRSPHRGVCRLPQACRKFRVALQGHAHCNARPVTKTPTTTSFMAKDNQTHCADCHNSQRWVSLHL